MPAIYSEIIVVCFVVLGGYFIFTAPIYTADIVSVFGMTLALGEIRGLLGLIVMVVAVWHKGRTEERLLLAEFGDEYAAYQREVGSLIPLPPRRSVRPADEHDRTGRPA